MKWFERPQYITDFWNENKANIKAYEKEFDWESCMITYKIIFNDKSFQTFEYSFDGVKPDGYE